MAADQGVAAAQLNLGVLYALGEGVPEDDVRAFAWLNVAAAQGSKKAAEAKDEIRQQMTAEQISRAQNISIELFDTIAKSP